jgi:hypothetical protein
MAQVNVVANRGDKPKDYAISTGTLTLGKDAIALSYNRNANLSRGDVQKFLEEAEQFLTTHSFPAA